MIESLRPARKCERKRRRTRRLGFETLEDRHLLAPLMMLVEEQIVIELINRARSDPAAEAARLGIDLNEGLPPGTISPTPKQPLAANQKLINAVRGHSQDMIDRDFFDHDNPDGLGPRERMVAAGYLPDWWGENIAYGYPSPSWFHSALFESPGHRTNILLDNFREVGVGLVYDEDYFDTLTGTENFGSRDGNAFFTGVAFSDNIMGDNFLTFGESLSDVTITAQRDGTGTTYTTTTGPSGGYSLQLPEGVYDLRAEGGDLEQPISFSSVYIGSRNVKVDFIVPYIPPEPDSYESNNTLASAADLGYGDQNLQHLTIHDESDEDYFRWTAHRDGQLGVELDLRRDDGFPSLVLLDTEGNILRYGEWSENGLSFSWDVEAGQSYVILVTPYGSPWDIHRDYDLMIDGPGGVAPQPDLFEPNDDFAAAVDIGQEDQTLTGLTAHVPGDRDVFLWTAVADGPVIVQVSSVATGDQVQLSLYNSQQQLLDQSAESDAIKSVSASVVAGDSLLIAIQAGNQTLLEDYSLQIDGVMPPVAADDRALTEPNSPVEIQLLLNDQADDGQLDAGSMQLVSLPQHGEVQLESAGGTIMYTPAPDFLGIDRFTYVVSDDRGNQSAPATVQVSVLDLDNEPWQNPQDPLDVNSDGVVSPIDVLFVIDYLNHHDAGTLTVPLTPLDFPPPFYDVNGDDRASPIDVLWVIDYLNTEGGEGGGEGGAVSATQFSDVMPWLPYRSFIAGRPAANVPPRLSPRQERVRSPLSMGFPFRNSLRNGSKITTVFCVSLTLPAPHSGEGSEDVIFLGKEDLWDDLTRRYKQQERLLSEHRINEGIATVTECSLRHGDTESVIAGGDNVDTIKPSVSPCLRENQQTGTWMQR